MVGVEEGPTVRFGGGRVEILLLLLRGRLLLQLQLGRLLLAWLQVDLLMVVVLQPLPGLVH